MGKISSGNAGKWFFWGIMRMLWVKRENREFFVPAGREMQGAADPKFFPEVSHADS